MILSGSSYPGGYFTFSLTFLQKTEPGLVKVILISILPAGLFFLPAGKKIEIILDWLLLVLTVNSLTCLI